MSSAYYNEHDPYAAQWLRNLIEAGHIAPGYVDERSIEDVRPKDLIGYTQCHFFAGVGVWSLALRRAGWPDSRHVWTGSCPCQPFSAAGKGDGFADERHLWPAFHYLIGQRAPVTVLGEQVASSDAMPWIDLVQTDMEALGYAFGAVPFPSAGVGAPHIRDRLYWLADSNIAVGRPNSPGRHDVNWQNTGRAQSPSDIEGRCTLSGLGDTFKFDANKHALLRGKEPGRNEQDKFETCGGSETVRPTGPVNGRWSDADWLFCRDGKWRPVEPGTFPLANGAPARVGRLRAYGNAINAIQAQAFIECLMD